MKLAVDDPRLYCYLNLLLSAEYINECMDSLEGTNAYSRKLKNLSNSFRRELNKVADVGISEIWGIEDDIMYELMQQRKELLHTISISRPEMATIIIGMIDKFNQAPDAVINWLGLKKKEVFSEAI